MKLPRKGILIRLAIYLPLLGFFGWRALDTWLERRAFERAQADKREQLEKTLEETAKTVTMPDGTTRTVHVLSPEQAEALWGVDVDDKAVTKEEQADGEIPSARTPPPRESAPATVPAEDNRD